MTNRDFVAAYVIYDQAVEQAESLPIPAGLPTRLDEQIYTANWIKDQVIQGLQARGVDETESNQLYDVVVNAT